MTSVYAVLALAADCACPTELSRRLGAGMVNKRRESLINPRRSNWFNVVDVVSRVAPTKSASSACVKGS